MRLEVRSLFITLLALAVTSAIPSQAQDKQLNSGGAVFVMTNNADRNEIISFRRASDGSLQRDRRFATGGRGTGGLTDPLESQGSLTLSQDHRWLFAVNGGSGEVSVFFVQGSRLVLTDKATSGGSEPNAVAQFGNLVYVLNVGGSSNVVGFRLNEEGQLHRIANSIRFFGTNNSEAASLAFSSDGRFLIATERATNNIDVFLVQRDGTLVSAAVNHSATPGVFAATFIPNGPAVVSETGPAGGNNASTISSYLIGADGALAPVSLGVPTLGNANCWNAVTPDGRFVYVSNAGSASIAGFAVTNTGALSPIGGTVVGTNPAGATNLDIAISADGKFLYTLNSGDGSIGFFAIQPDGTLNNLGETGNLPKTAGLNGIAAL